jgi:hypothetical protein
MEEQLRTALDLLNHDDQLTMDDRIALEGDLKYVMSDPKGELVPMKKKLIDIYLTKAAQETKDFIQGVIAKIAIESLKP